MSILLGPYDSSQKGKEETVEDMMVFGYQCKLYRDDVKAELESSGSLLIPWMGDSSLMVDRYDLRNHFDDKTQFGLKPNLPYIMSSQEEELENQLDEERYRSLGNEITEDELEETLKRNQDTYASVPYSYETKEEGSTHHHIEREDQVDHPSTDTVDIVQDETDMYTDPPELSIQFYIERPKSKKFQAIIERTAEFISRQGQQMEIIIKTKQRYNARFSFLHHDDRLFPYYKQLLHAIMDGTYKPQAKEEETTAAIKDDVKCNGEIDNGSKQEEEDDAYNEAVKERKRRAEERKNRLAKREDVDGDDDHEEMDLHPLLRTTPILPLSKTSKPQPVINSAPAISKTTPTSAIEDTNENSTTTTTTTATTTTATTATTATTDQTVYPGYDMMSAYYQASRTYQAGPAPPPPDVQPIADKTAEYVAKNGSDFGRTVILKHLDDRRFDFLHPWNQYHAYYKMKLKMAREEIEKNKPLNLQLLNAQGGVSFKLANKPVSTIQLPIGVVDLHYDEDDLYNNHKRSSAAADCEDKQSNKRMKINMELGGQIDGEFKKFLSTVKTLIP